MLTQAYSVHYGAFEVGGSTGYPINGPVRMTRSLDRGSLSFQVGVLGTSDADLATKIAAFEAAFTARRLRIRWLQNAAVRCDWNPAGTTDETMGFNAEAAVEKVGTPGGDTGRSVLYNVVLTARLPVVDQSGLKGLVTTVTTGPHCIRTVTIEGVVNARAEPSAQTATEVYTATAVALSTTQLDLVDSGATWKFHDDRTSRDETDTELSFTRVYVEQAKDVAEVVPSDTAVRDFAFAITEITAAPGDSGANVVRLRDFIVAVSATFCVSTVSDPRAYWVSSMRDFVLNHFRGVFGPQQMAITGEQVAVDRYNNGVNVVLQIHAAVGATNIVMSVTTTEITSDPGNVITKARSGQPLAGYVDRDVGSKTREVTSVTRVLGQPPADPDEVDEQEEGQDQDTLGGPTLPPGGVQILGGAGGGGASVATSGWIEGPTKRRILPVTEGVPGEDQMTYTDITVTRVDQYVVKPTGALAGTGLQPGAGGSASGIGGGTIGT